MKPSETTTVLRSLVPTKRPLFLWGPPGVGKSCLVRSAAAELGLDLIDVRAVLLDPVDLRGLPAVHNGRAVWCIPDFLPKEGRGVLFLDELAQAPPLVQSACLQLTLDRRIGEYVMPDGWSIVAASNRAEDKAGAHRLISPLLNRFIHIDVDVNNDDWHDWAMGSGIVPEVRSFIKFRPGLLHSFKPNDGQRSFPSPRTWEFVSQVLPATPADLWHGVVSGCIGDGPAAEFIAFVKLYRELPDMGDLLASPTTAEVSKEPSVLYAVCGALVEKIKQDPKADVTAAITYAVRMPPEFATLVAKDLMVIRPRVVDNPAMRDWVKKNRNLFIS